MYRARSHLAIRGYLMRFNTGRYFTMLGALYVASFTVACNGDDGWSENTAGSDATSGGGGAKGAGGKSQSGGSSGQATSGGKAGDTMAGAGASSDAGARGADEGPGTRRTTGQQRP